ncbi:hypothetical protein T265_01617 [Opisthorchis viverrini]|uniref:Uncharacterized protein n=1 Tax=Opisthorchis viverrini TaxID=6198 RepID=A0A075A9H6_OPIVI|nr:hypothetical protein T265_01617 [Opisthorchis viverrini]KER32395.1 hypothetical protein T265_01617 [Opisthorchis viverrini]
MMVLMSPLNGMHKARDGTHREATEKPHVGIAASEEDVTISVKGKTFVLMTTWLMWIWYKKLMVGITVLHERLSVQSLYNEKEYNAPSMITGVAPITKEE